MAEDAIPGRPAMMAGISDMARRGFYLGNVRDVRFSRVTIENHEGPAFYIETGMTWKLRIAGRKIPPSRKNWWSR
ncbi:hypothetical protein HMSSN036_78340 [Paenibacillus macerans]|nr:hypothetical protein HMSSN036_78340 [Paenibacillus macerans]